MFTEYFDFMAMNERFNNDEAWLILAMVNPIWARRMDSELNDADTDALEEEDEEALKLEIKVIKVYLWDSLLYWWYYDYISSPMYILIK